MSTGALTKELFFFYAFSVSIHWCTTNIYAKMCAPLSLCGMLKSAILTQSPTCQILNTTNNITLYVMNNIVTSSVSWILMRFTMYQKSVHA